MENKTDFSKKMKDIFTKGLITREIVIPITNIGKNLKQTLENKIKFEIEGKCIVDGYIKSDSVRIINYSNGIVQGKDIQFTLVVECLICLPVEGMIINCIAKNITKAGIRAETNHKPSPVVIFIARDHHHLNKYFSTIKEEDFINIRVIGQRFELNDKYISIIAELIESSEFKEKRKNKEGKKKKDKNIFRAEGNNELEQLSNNVIKFKTNDKYGSNEEDDEEEPEKDDDENDENDENDDGDDDDEEYDEYNEDDEYDEENKLQYNKISYHDNNDEDDDEDGEDGEDDDEDDVDIPDDE